MTTGREHREETITAPLVRVSPGKPLPFGATPNGRGTLFSVFSRHATAVSLLLFTNPRDSAPAHEIALDPRLNRTGDVWHAQVDGVGPGTCYLYRVDGPYQPEKGHRYNRNKLLLDPYVKAVTGNFTWNLADARGDEPAAKDRGPRMSTTSDSRRHAQGHRDLG